MICWETLSPGIYGDILLCSAQINTAAQHALPVEYWKWFLRIDFENLDNVMLSLLLGRKIFLGRMTIENQNQMNLNLSNHGSQCSLLLNLKDTNRKSLININNVGISCYICCIFVFNYTSSHKNDCCYCQVLMYNHKKKHAFSFDMKYF